jgi:hypothetical protein
MHRLAGQLMKAPSFSASLMLLSALLLSLSACATPETRLATGLTEAGLSKHASACLAREMADDLTLGQLIKVSKLGAFRETSIRHMSMADFIRATRALQDPAILKIASAAAIICTIS